jgi:hypothetical protein
LSGKIRLATPQKVLKKACNWLIFKKLSTISIKTICVSPARSTQFVIVSFTSGYKGTDAP